MTNRSYDVRVAALTVGVSNKWIDNLLSHHDIPGCSGGRQGVERRITDQGLVAIAAVHRLNKELGIPLGRAAGLLRAAADRSSSVIHSESGLRLEIPVREIEMEIQHRLMDAVQSAPQLSRGPKRRHRNS